MIVRRKAWWSTSSFWRCLSAWWAARSGKSLSLCKPSSKMSTQRSDRNPRHLGRDAAGQASVEALLVLVLMGLLIFGGIELSRGVAIRQALDSGAGASVRALALDPGQWG